jgi:hypothetical protein
MRYAIELGCDRDVVGQCTCGNEVPEVLSSGLYAGSLWRLMRAGTGDVAVGIAMPDAG